MSLPKEIKFLMYELPDEKGEVLAIVKDETLWTTQKGMAQLFNCSPDNISLYLKNIFKCGELEKDSVAEKISVTATDGKIA